MIPEWGNFSLILALGLALALTLLPMTGAAIGNSLLMHSGRSLATGFFAMVLLSFVFLTTAFVQDDFSVAYVATNSNSLLPVYYKISAVWGGHEGSLLLWVLMLAGWTFAIACFSKTLPLDMQARVLSVMGFIAVGFLLFMLLTSNPFDRILPLPPPEGGDLNPMLQDIGLIMHPPVLYMGYVGFSVTFAFALAALISGRMDSAWARWSRPWANMAWAFLSVGIALGSWWAYYELGWGGWWFWDPVENASFMPWLVGTALIHSLAVTEKRGIFKSWTILLAIFTFSLSLLGTFLVRSGILTSVHAFANDPERGGFILFFLLVVVGGSLVLYAVRAPVVKSAPGFTLLSRESFLLMNNMLLVIMMLTVLAGTLYPLIKSALNMGLISVGPPYFNITFLPLMALLCLLMAVGPLVNWKQSRGRQLLGILFVPALVSLAAGIAFPFLYDGSWSWQAALTVIIAMWIVTAILVDIRQKVRHAPGLRRGLGRLSLSYYGMVLAHLGLVVTMVGVCLTSVYNELRDVRMDIDKPVQVAEFEFVLEGVYRVPGPNYVADEALVKVSKNGKFQREMKPQKRRYLSNNQVMTEVALDPGLFRDLYLAMGEPLNNGAWAMRVHFKPFVRWIWLGSLMMAFGASLSVADKRYRKKTAGTSDQPEVQTA